MRQRAVALQDAEKVRQRHEPWRVTSEIGEKGATWSNWISPSLAHPASLACLAQLSCMVYSCYPRRATSEIPACQHSFSAASRTEPTRAERLEQRNVDRLDIPLTAQDRPHCFLSMGSGLRLRWMDGWMDGWMDETMTEPMMALQRIV